MRGGWGCRVFCCFGDVCVFKIFGRRENQRGNKNVRCSLDEADASEHRGEFTEAVLKGNSLSYLGNSSLDPARRGVGMRVRVLGRVFEDFGPS